MRARDRDYMHGLQVCSSHPPSCGCCSSSCNRLQLLLRSCMQSQQAAGACGSSSREEVQSYRGIQ
jgi:hypothetical protein